MNVSVVIPLYNAEKYIGKALNSCLALSEVKEILVIDDGYEDDARGIVEEYAQEHSIIKIFQHPNRKNCGAGASRNVGIKKATQEYISFLDADDFYLPNRFEKDKEVFNEFPDAEGCYNAIGVHFYSEEARHIFLKNFKNKTLTTVSKDSNPTPGNLFDGLIGKIKNYGYFSLNGLTVKKRSLRTTGIQFPHSSMHEDTEFNIYLAYYSQIYPAELQNPVAKRGVHEENRITKNFEQVNRKKFYNRYLQWKSIYKWAKEERVKGNSFKIIEQHFNFFRLAKNRNPRPKVLLKEVRNSPSILKNKKYGTLHKIYTLSLGKPICYGLFALTRMIKPFV